MHAEKYEFALSSLKKHLKDSGFIKVAIGLSGGIDSALVTTIAADALGAQNVITLMMPSCYTAASSVNDAKILATKLGTVHHVVPINNTVESFKSTLQEFFSTSKSTATWENLQARTRGVILMAFANELNLIVLATGNRSEIMTGYCTLYGDTCGGYAPISCFFKTEVYQLVGWRNENIPKDSLCRKINIVHDDIIRKAPTAELRENQKDSDSLPEYDILDKTLSLILDAGYNTQKLKNLGFDDDIVSTAEHLIKGSQHKRCQLAPGPAILKKFIKPIQT